MMELLLSPELWGVVSALLVVVLGFVGKKYSQYKKYSDIMIRGIEVASSNKQVKKAISELVSDAKVGGFSAMVQRVTDNIKSYGVQSVKELLASQKSELTDL